MKAFAKAHTGYSFSDMAEKLDVSFSYFTAVTTPRSSRTLPPDTIRKLAKWAEYDEDELRDALHAWVRFRLENRQGAEVYDYLLKKALKNDPKGRAKIYDDLLKILEQEEPLRVTPWMPVKDRKK